MEKIRYNKYEVINYTIDKIKNEIVFIVNYRTVVYNFIIDYNDLSLEDITQLRRFDDGTHHLWLIVNGDDYTQLTTTKRLVVKGSPIDKFVDREFPPITYINYMKYGTFTQLDGITTIIGMSGGGKTYSALQMLPVYANYFDKIAYLNYELTDRDIIERFDEMYPAGHKRKTIIEKLYIKDGVMTSLNLDEIMQAMEIEADEKVVWIIDNVGSVIGQEDNVWQKQNEFIKQLDTLCKERGWHALALTQMVKDHNLNLFDENNNIKESITMSIMSGSIMLGNLSRSVLFTAYNSETEQFKSKTLKRGTGKFYHDIEVKELMNEYITNPTKRRL